MARPQIENGFTSVANEILDEICFFKFNGAQLRIILKIWRLTYGYKRKDHDFSITFLHENTGLSESAVKKELKALIGAKVLIEVQKATRSTSRRLSFNKNYEEWIMPKSGDEMSEEKDQFNVNQGHDCAPNKEEDQVHDCDPHEVHDCIPNSDFEVHDCTPSKRNKDLKKSFKEKEALFDQFYSIYPRKVARKKAESSWRTLCKNKDFDPDLAIANTMNFIETIKLLGTSPTFIPYPSTYLNQKRYEDYPRVDPEGLAAAKETKIDSNLDFLKEQFGGEDTEQATSHLTYGKGDSELPE